MNLNKKDKMRPSIIDVLVIENDPLYRKKIARILKQANINSDIFANSSDAVKDISLNIRSYNCVVSIIYMEGLNGFEIVSYVKNIIGDIPVILMTDDCDIETERKAREIGIFYYLIKPFSDKEFLEVINDAIAYFEKLRK